MRDLAKDIYSFVYSLVLEDERFAEQLQLSSPWDIEFQDVQAAAERRAKSLTAGVYAQIPQFYRDSYSVSEDFGFSGKVNSKEVYLEFFLGDSGTLFSAHYSLKPKPQ